MEILIRRGERLYGPYSVAQIHEMLDAGSIILQDEAWSEAEGRWTALLTILGLSSDPSTDCGESIQVTLDSLLGNQPATDPGPASQMVNPGKQNRAANILSAVGLIAIALGTLDVALHMKDTAKPTEGGGSSQPSSSNSSDNPNVIPETKRPGTHKRPR